MKPEQTLQLANLFPITVDEIFESRQNLKSQIRELECAAIKMIPDLVKEIEEKYEVKIKKEEFLVNDYGYNEKIVSVPESWDALIELSRLEGKFIKAGIGFREYLPAKSGSLK